MTFDRPPGFWIRAAASVVDGTLIMAMGWALFFLGYGAWSWIMMLIQGQSLSSLPAFSDLLSYQIQIAESLVEVVVYLIYYTVFHARLGATPGKKLFSLSVIDAQTGSKLSLRKSTARTLCYLVSYLPVGAGFFMSAFHPSKLTLHDQLTRSRVVRNKS